MYLSPGISRALIDYRLQQDRPGTDPLTDRERQVLQLVAEGKTMCEISAVLSVSVKTAESHRTCLMRLRERLYRKPIHVHVDHQIACFSFAINRRHDLHIFGWNAPEVLETSAPAATRTELNVGESSIWPEFRMLRSRNKALSA